MLYPFLPRALLLGGLLCAGLWAVEATAATYYVRKSGDDSNSGTSPAEAWQTVSQAAETLVAGDRVYVGAGVYWEQIRPSNSGTEANPIQFIADSDGAQTGDAGDVDLQYGSSSWAIRISNRHHIHFRGFRIPGGRGARWRSGSVGGLLEECEIFDSNAQGVVATGVSGLDLKACIIRASDDQGVLVEDGSTCQIINCLIISNPDHGISVLGNSNVTVWNTTLAYNNASGIDQDSGTLAITNSIIAYNETGVEISGGSTSHTYNLVFGNSDNYKGTSSGAGEINSDPKFLGAEDYRLQADSPAIDAGTDATDIVDRDLDGKPRPIGATWDMGCYEFGDPAGQPKGVRILKWIEIK